MPNFKHEMMEAQHIYLVNAKIPGCIAGIYVTL